MTVQNADDKLDLVQALSSSGFPFQTAVASAIRALGHFEVWEELAWRHRDGTDKFLDIVAIGQRVRVTIECKKTANEKFVFLLPNDVSVGVETDRIYGVYLHQIQDSTKRGGVKWGTMSALPTSRESVYCVAKSSNSSRLIETDVQPLVTATEAYALDRYKDFKPNAGESINVPCIPVLVTNAPLYVFPYTPSEVSLETGVVQVRSDDLVPIPFVRLTKEFTTSFHVDARRRTVIVCRAAAISEMLVQMLSADVIKPESAIALAS